MKSVFLCTVLLLVSFSAVFSQKAIEKNYNTKTLTQIDNPSTDNYQTAFRQNIFKPKKVKKKEFQAILDSANVSGSILIWDFYAATYYSNDFKHCKKGYLPASTFKIVNSIIALETGVVEDLNTMFYWDSVPRRLDIWNRDLNFHDAFHASCVPCFQEIAREIGVERMNEYLKKLNYGNMIVDSSNIDKFWLEGESKISQFEQVDFLMRLYFEELNISRETTDTTFDLMLIEKDEYGYLYGKTGWAIRNGQNIGWFVGFIEDPGNYLVFFATNIEPNEEFNMDMFPMIRKNITKTVLISVINKMSFNSRPPN
jgi:beta-lactamase class D